jgi:hypothetical protein
MTKIIYDEIIKNKNMKTIWIENDNEIDRIWLRHFFKNNPLLIEKSEDVEFMCNGGYKVGSDELKNLIILYDCMIDASVYVQDSLSQLFFAYSFIGRNEIVNKIHINMTGCLAEKLNIVNETKLSRELIKAVSNNKMIQFSKDTFEYEQVIFNPKTCLFEGIKEPESNKDS